MCRFRLAWLLACCAYRLVVAEQNAVAGWANKVVARYAKAAAVSFEGTDLPRSHLTGNPVRQQILLAAAGGNASQRVNQEGRPLAAFNVVVLGGFAGRGAHKPSSARSSFWLEGEK